MWRPPKVLCTSARIARSAPSALQQYQNDTGKNRNGPAVDLHGLHRDGRCARAAGLGRGLGCRRGHDRHEGPAAAIPLPTEKLVVSIHEDVEGAPLLVAGVSFDARPFDSETMQQLNHRYLSVPLKAWLLIHFQAIRLLAKRVGFYHDPGAPEEETSIDPQRGPADSSG